MKKTKLAAIIGLSVCMLASGCARHKDVETETPTEMEPYYNNVEDWYDADGNILMPVIRDGDLWLNNLVYLDRRKLCELPDELLKTATTSELVILMTQCPRNYYMIKLDDIKFGMEEVKKTFNGLRELLNREDCVEEVLKFYNDYQIPEKKSFHEEEAIEAGLTDIEDMLRVENFRKQISEDLQVRYALNSCEWVLTQEDIVNQLSDEQIKEIVKAVKEKNAQLQETEYADSIVNYLLYAASYHDPYWVDRYGL